MTHKCEYCKGSGLVLNESRRHEYGQIPGYITCECSVDQHKWIRRSAEKRLEDAYLYGSAQEVKDIIASISVPHIKAEMQKNWGPK